MKKGFSVIQKLILLLIVGGLILSGCVKPDNVATSGSTPDFNKTLVNETEQIGGTETPAQTQEPKSEIPINVDPILVEGMQLDFMYPWIGKVDVTLQALINEFNKQNEWGVIVSGIAVGGAEPMFDVLNEKNAVDDVPDLIALNPYLIKNLDGENYWTELNKYIHDPIWGLGVDSLMEIPEVYLSQNKEGDQIFGLPFSLSANGLFYNLTWATELGFNAPPSTHEELKEQLCKAAESMLLDNDIENNGTGGLLLSRTPLSILSWYQSFGGTIPDSVTAPQFSNQFSTNTFTYIKNLFDGGCAWVGRQSVPYDYFAKRYALVYEGKLEDIMIQTDAFLRNQNADEWIMIPYPTTMGEGSMVVDAMSLAIPVTKPEVQLAAWIFMRWMIENGAQITFSQASGTWPARYSALSSMSEFVESYPQWEDLLPYPDIVSAGPSYLGWLVDKMVLEDAWWRYLQSDVATLPEILAILDETLMELNDR